MKLDPNSVASREQLAKFVEALREDLLSYPSQWENPTLDRFLSALCSYIEDVPGFLKNTGSSLSSDAPSWQLFATVLVGAKIYE